MKLLKPAKILSFIAVVGLCTYYSVKLQAYASKEIQLYKRELVTQIISQDLAKKEWRLNPKDRPINFAKDLSSDELRKALWITTLQKEQLQLTIESGLLALDGKLSQEVEEQ